MTFPDIDSLNAYDGAKVNYANVEDPTTDRDASAANQAYASTAAMTHTAARCWVRFIGNATVPPLASSNSFDAGWLGATATAPVVNRTALGVYTVAWPAIVGDEISTANSHTVNLRACKASVEGSSGPYFVQSQVTAANLITVWVFNSAGSANDAVGVTLFVAAI